MDKFAKYITAYAFPVVVLLLCLLYPPMIPGLVIMSLLSLLAHKIFQSLASEKSQLKAKTRLESNPLIKPIIDGFIQIKPIIFGAFYIAAAPISVFMIAIHWLKQLIKGSKTESIPSELYKPDSTIIVQNKQKESESENSFYNSKAFAVTMFLVSAIGFPTIVTMGLYQYTDVKDIITTSKTYFQSKPQYNYNKTVKIYNLFEEKPFYLENDGVSALYPDALAPTPMGTDWPSNKILVADAVEIEEDESSPLFAPIPRYAPLKTSKSLLNNRRNITKKQIGIGEQSKVTESSPDRFAALLYIFSIGWCLSALFIRAYFIFPLNFASTEYDIELNESGVKKHPIKGWFSELLWYTWPAYLPRELEWSDIKRIYYEEDGIGQLSPLPDSLFPKESLVYKVLNKLALIIDALHNKIGRSQYLSISDNPDAASGNEIRIRLWELTSQEKAKLYYSIKKYVPNIYLDKTIQEKLLGRQVNDEAKYTQIWFDILIKNVTQTNEVSVDANRKVKDYQIRYKLNSGGQANIYLAKNTKGQNFVLKEFTLSQGDSFGSLLESASDFENEALILSSADTESVVKLIDFFAEGKRAYLVLEYINGTTIRDCVNDAGTLKPEVAIELAIQMCSSLEYLHSLDSAVVHCDFTPENIMLTKENRIKVIDFSVAHTNDDVRFRSECVGKHSYTPPEQFRGEPTCQSDIYALGAMIAFMITGTDPKPISTTTLNQSELGKYAELSKIVKKATELNPDDRYESASWMKLELIELQEELNARQENNSENEAKSLISNMVQTLNNPSSEKTTVSIKLDLKEKEKIPNQKLK